MLVDILAPGNALILSGAGLSTESGIPDYRGPTGLARRATPMTNQTFTSSATARRRYWARSYLGWRHIAQAVPNSGHLAVAELSRRGLLTGIITQNVDGLHQAAGAADVTELHGSLHRVHCLSCGQRTSRAGLDRRRRRIEDAVTQNEVGAVLGIGGSGDGGERGDPCRDQENRPKSFHCSGFFISERHILAAGSAKDKPRRRGRRSFLAAC